MTREEAIKAIRHNAIVSGPDWEASWIDRFVALGMLKLDEPNEGGKMSKIAIATRYEIKEAASFKYEVFDNKEYRWIASFLYVKDALAFVRNKLAKEDEQNG